MFYGEQVGSHGMTFNETTSEWYYEEYEKIRFSEKKTQTKQNKRNQFLIRFFFCLIAARSSRLFTRSGGIL
jgi:septin family protein